MASHLRISAKTSWSRSGLGETRRVVSSGGNSYAATEPSLEDGRSVRDQSRKRSVEGIRIAMLLMNLTEAYRVYFLNKSSTIYFQ